MTPPSRAFLWRLTLLLAGLSMFGPFAIDSVFPAFPALQADFFASHAAVQQTISVYLAAYALMSILHGPLSDAVGRRPVILAGVAVFVLACVGAAMAQNLFWLLVFRALQGMSAGAGLIVARAVIRDCLDGDPAQKLMAQATMIFSVAPAIAPIIGGWILGWTTWHGIFWAMALFAFLVLLACLAWMPESHPAQARTPLRLRPLVRRNWAILKNPRFLQLSLAACLNFGAMFLYISSAPVVVLDFLGLNEQQFGWMFVPIVTGLMLGSFLSSRLAGRASQSTTAKIGFGLSLFGALANLIHNLAVDHLALPWAVIPLGFAAAGIGTAFPLLTILMLDMYPRHRGSAASIQAFTSLSINALIAGALAPLLAPHRLGLAWVSLSMCAAAIALWWRYRRGIRRDPVLPRTRPMIEKAEQL